MILLVFVFVSLLFVFSSALRPPFFLVNEMASTVHKQDSCILYSVIMHIDICQVNMTGIAANVASRLYNCTNPSGALDSVQTPPPASKHAGAGPV